MFEILVSILRYQRNYQTATDNDFEEHKSTISRFLTRLPPAGAKLDLLYFRNYFQW